MRVLVFFALSVGLFWSSFAWVESASRAAQKDDKKDDKKDEKKDDKSAVKDTGKLTPAAELTRTKSLKAKMSVSFTNARLGDALKEFAAQVDMKVETQLLWTYGAGFPYAEKVTYACKDKPLEVALDELFKKVGDLGYIVVSKDGDKYDGWVLLTTTGERGYEKARNRRPRRPKRKKRKRPTNW